MLLWGLPVATPGAPNGSPKELRNRSDQIVPTKRMAKLVVGQAQRLGGGQPSVRGLRDAVDERIAGLDAGADDYLGKPFDLQEVEARLRALVRRSLGADDVVQVGRLRLDRVQRRLAIDEAELVLPAREFEVLWELMTPPGRVVAKRALSEKLSALDEALGDNALEAFISRLRKKLHGSGAGIRTLRGIGYVLEEVPI